MPKGRKLSALNQLLVVTIDDDTAALPLLVDECLLHDFLHGDNALGESLIITNANKNVRHNITMLTNGKALVPDSLLAALTVVRVRQLLVASGGVIGASAPQNKEMWSGCEIIFPTHHRRLGFDIDWEHDGPLVKGELRTLLTVIHMIVQEYYTETDMLMHVLSADLKDKSDAKRPDLKGIGYHLFFENVICTKDQQDRITNHVSQAVNILTKASKNGSVVIEASEEETNRKKESNPDLFAFNAVDGQVSNIGMRLMLSVKDRLVCRRYTYLLSFNHMGKYDGKITARVRDPSENNGLYIAMVCQMRVHQTLGPRLCDDFVVPVSSPVDWTPKVDRMAPTPQDKRSKLRRMSNGTNEWFSDPEHRRYMSSRCNLRHYIKREDPVYEVVCANLSELIGLKSQYRDVQVTDIGRIISKAGNITSAFMFVTGPPGHDVCPNVGRVHGSKNGSKKWCRRLNFYFNPKTREVEARCMDSATCKSFKTVVGIMNTEVLKCLFPTSAATMRMMGLVKRVAPVASTMSFDTDYNDDDEDDSMFREPAVRLRNRFLSKKKKKRSTVPRDNNHMVPAKVSLPGMSRGYRPHNKISFTKPRGYQSQKKKKMVSFVSDDDDDDDDGFMMIRSKTNKRKKTSSSEDTVVVSRKKIKSGSNIIEKTSVPTVCMLNRANKWHGGHQY